METYSTSGPFTQLNLDAETPVENTHLKLDPASMCWEGMDPENMEAFHLEDLITGLVHFLLWLVLSHTFYKKTTILIECCPEFCKLF